MKNPDDPETHIFYNASKEPRQLNEIDFDMELSFATGYIYNCITMRSRAVMRSKPSLYF